MFPYLEDGQGHRALRKTAVLIFCEKRAALVFPDNTAVQILYDSLWEASSPFKENSCMRK